MRLSLGNVTTRDMSVIAQKQLDFEPKIVRQARNRGSFKVLLYNSAAQEIQMLDEKLSKVEQIFGLNIGDEDLIDILQTQLQVIYYTKHRMGIFRLNSKMDQSSWVCSSPFFAISQVAVEHANPNLIMSISHDSNVFQIHEFQGTSKTGFQCRPRGILRFDGHLSGLRFKEMMVQPATNQIWFTFMSSNQIMFLAYDEKNIVSSLFVQNPKQIVANQMYTVADSSDYKLLISERYLLLEVEDRQTFFISVLEETQAYRLGARLAESEGGVPNPFGIPSNQSTNDNWFSPELAQKLLMPIAFVCVLIYQFYCKKSASASKATAESPLKKYAQPKQ